MVLPARSTAMVMTADEFLNHPELDGKAELVRGELLAIEVLSPSETASDLQEKLDDYKVAGTPGIARQ